MMSQKKASNEMWGGRFASGPAAVMEAINASIGFDKKLYAEDIRGSIARIAGLLANHGLNIATLRLTRKERGGDAFMVIELDERPDEKVRDEIRGLSWVRWAYRLDKVSG